MKYVYLFRKFFKKIRWSAFFLSLMMTGAILLGIFTFGVLQRAVSDRNILASAKKENVYY